jgi:hypothetical protein
MSVKQVQIKDWLEKCKYNIYNFKKDYYLFDDERKKDFIRNQYRLISIINSVLCGRTKLVGIDRRRFDNLENQ